MSPPAVTAILEQHQALGAVLRSFRLQIERARHHGTPPDFGMLRAMLFYLDEVPAQLHHAKESTHLFPRLRARCPPLRPVLDRLEAEHARGEIAIRELERALLAFEVLGEPRRAAFEAAAERYVSTYIGHMEVEEDYVIPVALDCLTASDWAELDAAFSVDHDPAERDIAEACRALLRRVLFQGSLPSFCR